MAENPSGEAALLLRGALVGSARIHGLRLPVSAPAAWERMRRAIRRHDAGVVIALGVAAGADTIRVECTARNCADYRIPDNAGLQPRGERISRGGEGELKIAADAAAVTRVLERAGLPVRLSDDAGLYVCNDLYYRLLRYAARPGSRVRHAMFIHVPEASVASPAQVAAGLQRVVEHLCG